MYIARKIKPKAAAGENENMLRKSTLLALALSAVIVLSFGRGHAGAQEAAAVSRIGAAIDESKLTVLHGNTHPMIRGAFDRGAAADTLQMDHMLLVLQPSAAQQAALEKLLAAQQDKNSSSYHQWLSPDEFGQQFGASDEDIQKVTRWLESHGFQVHGVSHGRNLVNFSGNAAQVRAAFHTSMHQYVVNDRDHLSNASDPAIPAALAPVVAGVASLNNFFPRPNYHATSANGMKATIHPHLTLTDANSNTLYGVGPTDFATIYGITSLWNAGVTGTGQTIAIVSGSDINTADVDQFRTIFGLPAISFQQVIPGGATDPGIVTTGGTFGDQDETEAIFDVEWSGAVAKNAKIDLVAAKDTTTTAGIDLSAEWIVDTKLAPILSESYGQCEMGLGSAQNTMYSNLWSQAAAEGITVSVSTGDNGSDGCDFAPTGSASGPHEGKYGLGVNGIASTPYNIAVGGTDFNNHTPATNGNFWTSTNASGTLASAKSYVPELAWNDTCTNSIIYGAFGLGSGGAACNSTTVQNDGNSGGFFFVAPVGGSGGVSSCTTANTSVRSNCSGGYAKPSWQTGPGVPADGKRDMPDVSFFAEGGGDSYGLEVALGATAQNQHTGSFYFACEMDAQGSSNPTSCNVNGAFLLGGGTSISAQVFAGVMALIDQSAGSPQGNINTQFYALAASQSGLNCNSSSTTVAPNGACIFHDVTVGTNAMPCLTPSTSDGTNDCSTAGGSPIGILTGYTAGTGYDQVTGLGSINVANLAANLSSLAVAASPTTVTVASPGQSGSTTLTFTASNGFSGTVNTFACSGLPSGATCAFTQNGSAVSSLTFSNTTTSAQMLLTINTKAPTSGAIPPTRLLMPGRWHPGPMVILEWLMVGFAMLATFVMAARSKQRRLVPVMAVLAFAMIVVSAGCGGAVNSSGGGGGGGTTGGTPTGTTTTTVSVTNASTSAVTSANLTLTVQ
jgi:subtilase family serine protease